MTPLQYLSGTNQRANSQLTQVGAKATEHVECLGGPTRIVHLSSYLHIESIKIGLTRILTAQGNMTISKSIIA